jgi:hypothetical protein
MVAALLCIAGLLGPPKLPPMPGQDMQAQPKPTTPAAKPSTPAKTPAKTPSTTKPTTPAAKPTTPATTPASPPAGEPPPPAFAPEPVGTPEDPFQLPDAKAEPPQPEPTAAPPASSDTKPSRRPGAREPLGPEIRGDAERETPKIPPPKRPPFSGVGLFAGAGVSFAIAISEQVVAHVLVKRRCIDPVVEQGRVEDPPEEEAEQIGNAIIKCAPGVLPAIALRVHSDLALLSLIGMAAAGAMLRGQRDAYDHAFKSRSRKDIAKLRWAGVGMIAGGAVVYLVTGPTAWGILAKCDTGKCATRARIMGFTTRDVSAAMIAAGAGMLGYSEAYRKHHESYSRDRALSVAPSFGRGFAGLSLSGRF